MTINNVPIAHSSTQLSNSLTSLPSETFALIRQLNDWPAGKIPQVSALHLRATCRGLRDVFPITSQMKFAVRVLGSINTGIQSIDLQQDSQIKNYLSTKIKLAEQYIILGKKDKGKSYLEEAIQVANPKYPYELQRISEIFIKANFFAEAIKTITLINNPNLESQLLSTVVKAQLDNGLLQDAISTFKSMKESPQENNALIDNISLNKFNAFNAVGEALLKFRLFDQLISLVDLIENAQLKGCGLTMIFKAQVGLKLYDQAIATMELILDYPNKPFLFLEIVDDQLKAKKYDNAIDSLRFLDGRVTNHSNTHPVLFYAHERIINALVQAKLYQKAMTIVKLIERPENQIESYCNIAVAQANTLSSKEEALASFNHAIAAAELISNAEPRCNKIKYIAGRQLEVELIDAAQSTLNLAMDAAHGMQDSQGKLYQLNTITNEQMKIGVLLQDFNVVDETLQGNAQNFTTLKDLLYLLERQIINPPEKK